MKRVLITGAGGYIGQQTVSFFLHKKFNVVALVRDEDRSGLEYHPSLQITQGDIVNLKSMVKVTKKVDYVIHLAAVKSDQKDSYLINVLGSKNIIKASQMNKVKRIIYISTSSVKIVKRGVYAKTKLEAEELFLHSSVPVSILRPSIVYSENLGGIFKTLVVSVSKFPIIPIFGNGKNKFYPIHIYDLNTAIWKSITTFENKNKIYDIGGPDGVSFNKLIYLISGNLDKKIKILHIPAWLGIMAAKILSFFFTSPPISESNILGSSQNIEMNVKKSYKEFGFRPISLRVGLKRAIGSKTLIQKETEIIFNYILRFSGRKINKLPSYTKKYRQALKVNKISEYKASSWIFKSPVLLGGIDFLTVFYRKTIIAKKIFIAAAIIEADTISADWLLPQRRTLIKLVNISLNLFISLLSKAFIAFVVLLTPNFYEKYFK